jgi:hypothetical protein
MLMKVQRASSPNGTGGPARRGTIATLLAMEPTPVAVGDPNGETFLPLLLFLRMADASGSSGALVGKKTSKERRRRSRVYDEGFTVIGSQALKMETRVTSRN